MNDNFNISINANISAAAALEKISQIPQWWGVTIEGDTTKLKDKFIIKMGPEAWFNCAVSELELGKRIVWTVDECYMPWYTDKHEWTDTKMIFELSEHGDETTLTFTHQGLTPEIECYKDCQPGWTHWIQNSLLSYFTTGQGDFKQR